MNVLEEMESYCSWIRSEHTTCPPHENLRRRVLRIALSSVLAFCWPLCMAERCKLSAGKVKLADRLLNETLQRVEVTTFQRWDHHHYGMRKVSAMTRKEGNTAGWKHSQWTRYFDASKMLPPVTLVLLLRSLCFLSKMKKAYTRNKKKKKHYTRRNKEFDNSRRNKEFDNGGHSGCLRNANSWIFSLRLKCFRRLAVLKALRH